MSRKDRKKEALGSLNDGTAARIRPLSFEEIMSKRKNKLSAEDKEAVMGLKEQFVQGHPKASLDHSKTYRANNGLKDAKEKVRETFKKTEEHEKKKEHSERKDKSKLDPEANSKVKYSHSKSNRDKESKNEKHNQHRSRDHDVLGDGTDKENDNKKQKHDIGLEKLGERGRKSRTESKREEHNFVEAKNKSEVDVSKSRRHDFGKFRHAEYTERNDRWKEDSKHYHEEPRSKRRRSRSRETNRERDRSVSLSPRAQKRAHHGHDHEDSSPYHSKDKSRRKYSDGDTQKSSGNGGHGSGHHRKHGSGLGGYSPRKRRSEAAARTPSPTIRSPERKTATWDQPPSATSNTSTGQMLSSFHPSFDKIHELASSLPAIPAAKISQTVSSIDITSIVSASIDSIQLTQATRPMRRLYIENLPASASEKAMIDCLNEFLLSTGVNHIKGTTPCISCMINKEKCQALVEFLTPQDATAALSLDGRSFSGSILKIRRPKDFVEAATGSTEKPKEEVKVVSNVVKDSPHKIFVGGFSKNLSSDMLMEIVSAFGTLKAFHFNFNEEISGPCAFLEYVDHSITLKACAGLNGMKLGRQVLTAVQAFPDSLEEENAEISPSYDIPMHAKPLLSASTKVLQLKNLLNREEFFLLSESELEEFLDDIRLECTRFGTVKSVNIIRYSMNPGIVTEDSGYPDGGSARIESRKESPIISSKHAEDMPIPNSKQEPQDAMHDVKDMISKDEMWMEENEQQYTVSYENDEATICEEDPQPQNAIIIASDMTANVELKEPGIEGGLVFESPKLENADIKLEDYACLNDSPARKALLTGDSHEKVLDGVNLNGKHVTFEKANLHLTAMAKSDIVDEGLALYEPGCVLVEFLREEATCMAAHCLHGRTYSENVVVAGFFPHDLYLARFRR